MKKNKAHYKRKHRYEGESNVFYIPTKKVTDWLKMSQFMQWLRDVWKPEPHVDIEVGDHEWVWTESGKEYVLVDTQDFANFLNGKPNSGGEL